MESRRLYKQLFLALLLTLTTLVIGFLTTTRFVFFHHYEGLFLLRGNGDKKFDLQDDLFLGDGSRLIYGFELDWLENWWRELGKDPLKPYLTWEWDKDEGYGYVIGHFPGGERLLINLSRYCDSQGRHTQGLFVGGARPESADDRCERRQADTGMAWHDGKRWHHLWCNTNEGISSPVSRTGSPPNHWQFLGSRVLIGDNDKLVLSSTHLIELDRTQLQMERFAYFTAGNPYFSLGIVITNMSRQPIRFNYLYADEPWVGDYGTSAGDIGWTRDGLVLDERLIDPSRHYFAGMVDHGNPLINEPGEFSGIANFIAWSDGSRPDRVFFANKYFGFRHSPEERVPLQGDARSLGLDWENRTLLPGEKTKLYLRLGVAAKDPASGLPTIPPLRAFPDFRALGNN